MARSLIAVSCMHERIQFLQKPRYSRIVARIPADLEQVCRRLVRNEGWELGDLFRSLILLGACGSFLTLRSSKPRGFVRQPLSERAEAVLGETSVCS